MKIKHVKGVGEAHKLSQAYVPWFGCPMEATFNVRADQKITDFKPAKVSPFEEGPGKRLFWLVRIDGHYAWVLRWPGTNMAPDHLELVSKARLPDYLCKGSWKMEVLEPRSAKEIAHFSRKYFTKNWHQTFSWSHRKFCDSQMIFDTILPHAEFPGSTVLDIGCAYGYHSFVASRAGALVTAYDKDLRCRHVTREINDHIEMQDVAVNEALPTERIFDYIFYFSVHHQVDPQYTKLSDTLLDLRCDVKKALFVELILPPMFGTPEIVKEAMAEAEELLTYRHPVRGQRAIYVFK